MIMPCKHCNSELQEDDLTVVVYETNIEIEVVCPACNHTHYAYLYPRDFQLDQ